MVRCALQYIFTVNSEYVIRITYRYFYCNQLVAGQEFPTVNILWHNKADPQIIDLNFVVILSPFIEVINSSHLTLAKFPTQADIIINRKGQDGSYLIAVQFAVQQNPARLF